MNTIGMAFGGKQFQSPAPSINNDGSLMQWKENDKSAGQGIREI